MDMAARRKKRPQGVKSCVAGLLASAYWIQSLLKKFQKSGTNLQISSTTLHPVSTKANNGSMLWSINWTESGYIIKYLFLIWPPSFSCHKWQAKLRSQYSSQKSCACWVELESTHEGCHYVHIPRLNPVPQRLHLHPYQRVEGSFEQAISRQDIIYVS